MKHRFGLMLASGIAVALAQAAPAADTQPAAPAPGVPAPAAPSQPGAPAAQPPRMAPRPAMPTPPPYKPVMKDEKTDYSYAWGANMGNFVRNSKIELDVDVLLGALKDALAGVTNKMNEEQAQAAVRSYQMAVRTKMESERTVLVEKNHKQGDAFFAENAKKDGVKSHTVNLPGGKTATFQYKVLAEGSGESPKATDTVVMNYRGRLLDGREFDSSAKHPQPSKFPVSGVVKGWTEALQMMKVGSKWELYLPADLAYGDFGNRGNSLIEPGAALVFEMELVSFEAPAPRPTPPGPGAGPAIPQQPLTSDIIRVPSADELKKGAKPEVIKAEDLDKRIKEEQAKDQSKDKK